MSEGGDLRTFIRETMILLDRRAARTDARLRLSARRAAEERRRYFEAHDRRLDLLARQVEEDVRRTDDILAESRAQRGALLKILDKLDNGGPATAG
jgi:hypothetical protein